MTTQPGESPSKESPATNNPSLIRRYLNWRDERQKAKLERAKRIGPVREWIELIITVLVMVFFIRLAVVEAFRIPTGSMENTLLVGDFLLVNKFVYGIRSPDWIGIPFTTVGKFIPNFRLPSIKDVKPGDVVVFRYPIDPNLSYIKRCVAIAGQTVEIHEKQLYVDGVLQDLPPHSKFASDLIYPKDFIEDAITPRTMEMRNRDNYGPVKVPEGHVFCLGDNRDNSADSRYWGFLNQDLIIGEALIIYFSWDAKEQFLKLNKKIRWERIGNLIH